MFSLYTWATGLVSKVSSTAEADSETEPGEKCVRTSDLTGYVPSAERYIKEIAYWNMHENALPDGTKPESKDIDEADDKITIIAKYAVVKVNTLMADAKSKGLVPADKPEYTEEVGVYKKDVVIADYESLTCTVWDCGYSDPVDGSFKAEPERIWVNKLTNKDGLFNEVYMIDNTNGGLRNYGQVAEKGLGIDFYLVTYFTNLLGNYVAEKIAAEGA